MSLRTFWLPSLALAGLFTALAHGQSLEAPIGNPAFLDKEGVGGGQVAGGFDDCNGNGIGDSLDIGPDNSGRKIHWADSGANKIQRSNLDGTDVEDVITAGLVDPSGVTLDPIAGFIYFTDFGNHTIKRANLDGSGVVTLVSGLTGDPTDVQLDLTGGKMYWPEFLGGQIKRANLNGTSVETLISAGITGPRGIALDVPGGKMYFTTRNGALMNTIMRANLNGTGLETVVTGGSDLDGIALDLARGKVYWASINNDIWRANLDGSNPGIFIADSNNPRSLALDLVHEKVYWTVTDTDRVRRANLDGTGVVDLVTGLSSPRGLALDLTSADCNGNGIPDDCDIGGSLSYPIRFGTIIGTNIPDCPANHLTNPSRAVTINVPDAGLITDLDVIIDLTHTAIGNLLITLTHDDTGTSIALMSRIGLSESGPYCTNNVAGGCSGDNLPSVTFDDEATSDIETACPPVGQFSYYPNPGGSGLPGRLSEFDNEIASGTWTLEIFDGVNLNIGDVASVELHFTVRSASTELDCNFNGSPDDCDISTGVSLDVNPADGVPDECRSATGGCTTPGQEDYWTCFPNWDIPGNVYPDDEQGGLFAGNHAAIDPGVDLFLNETVRVPSLHVKPGASLSVTQQDNPNPALAGDFFFSSPAIVLQEGAMYVDWDRQIGEPDSLVGSTNPIPWIVAAEGVYEVNPAPVAPVVTATLHARDMVVLTGEPGSNGGRVELSDHMSAIISNNLTLSGSTNPIPWLPLGGRGTPAGRTDVARDFSPWNDDLNNLASGGRTKDSPAALNQGPKAPGNIRSPSGRDADDFKSEISNLKSEISNLRDGSVAGGYTPPVVRVRNSAILTVSGDMVISTNGSVENTSIATVYVGGNFVNESVKPRSFDMSYGRIVLNGTQLRGFEVAGLELGADLSGFKTTQNTLGDAGGSAHTNFAFGTLEIAPESEIIFSNGFANTTAAGVGCREALYVRKLVLGAGSFLWALDCKVYYGTLVDNGATLFGSGCGAFIQVSLPPALAPDPSGLNKSRFISFSKPSSGGVTALRVKPASLHRVVPSYTGAATVPFAQFEGRTLWVGTPKAYLESGSNRTPFLAATLQCSPNYRDWSQLRACTDNAPPFEYDSFPDGRPMCVTDAGCGPGEICTTMNLLHVTGPMIVPASAYGVENVDDSCTGSEADCVAVSAPLAIPTTRWGDVETPYNPPSTTTQPDLADISALVNKFRSAAGAPIKARALLAGTDAWGNINVTPSVGFDHISVCVDAFRGQSYPYKPGQCSGNPSASCTVDANCFGICIANACVGGPNPGMACVNNAQCFAGVCNMRAGSAASPESCP